MTLAPPATAGFDESSNLVGSELVNVTSTPAAAVIGACRLQLTARSRSLPRLVRLPTLIPVAVTVAVIGWLLLGVENPLGWITVSVVVPAPTGWKNRFA